MRVIRSILFFGALSCPSLAAAQQAAPEPSSSASSPAVETTSEPASSGDAKAEAIERFQRGIELYEERDFNAALVELRRANELAPNYKLLFNIGQVCYQLADYACALISFQEYLARGNDSIASERRDSVSKDIQKLNHRVARLELVANVGGAMISVDDKPVGTTPLQGPVVVNAGTRKVTASKPGMSTVVRVVELPGSDAMRVMLRLEPLGGSVADAPKPPSVDAAPRGKPSRWTTWSWAGVGASGALAAGAVATGLLAKDAADELRDMRYAGEQVSPQLRDQSSKASTLAITSDVLTLASVATLVTTLVVTVTRRPEKRAGRTPANGGLRIGLARSGISVGGDL
jgi:hypothetical protein